MAIHAFKLGAGALSLVLLAACARDADTPPPPDTTTTTTPGAQADLDSWNPTPEEIDVLSEQEYQQQARQRINESNVDEEYRRLQQELGGGGG